MDWTKTKISAFLKEREDRFKPEEANELGLQRLEKIDFSGKICLNANKQTNTGMILVKKGDLVISGINVEKGAVAVYQGDEDILATIHYSSYQFDEKKIDVEFFKWFLKSAAFREALSTQIKGGIKTELKPKRFLPLEIYLPDIKTQKEISKKLNAVKDEINETMDIQYENEKLVDKLRQQILSEAVAGKLVSQNSKEEPASELLKKIKKDNLKDKDLLPFIDEEYPYQAPKGWVWVRMGEICDKVHYGFTASADFNKISYRLLRITDIQNDAVDWKSVPGCEISDEEAKKYLLAENDILIARTGGTIGKSYLVKNVNVKAVFASYLIRLIPNKNMNADFLKYFLGSKLYWEQLYEKSMGTGQPNVNGVSLSNLKFALPPLAEQKRIVEKVDSLMKICDELEKNIKENQKNADSLMGAVLKEAFENEA